MNENEILASAQERIAKNRTADIELNLKAPDGRPVSAAKVHVKLTDHGFRFGCNAFLITRIKDAEMQHAYEERFAALLNYATLPFYWGGYEYQPGKTMQPALEAMAQWCLDNRVAAKGHPLVWHEVYPGWAKAFSDEEILRRLQERVRGIVSHFNGLINTWDVVNEAIVSPQHDNAVGRWIKRDGAAQCVTTALQWAHEANPQAELLYNDFDTSPKNEQLVESLVKAKAPMAAIGIQSHMHKDLWPISRAWHVCERFGRFGLPIHFTELTVLSGALKAKDDNDWHKRRTDWKTAPEGESAQAEYGEKLYTVLFSHPAVEAITWWDFSDHGAWQGAPAGLVRENMSPKPLYTRLLELVRGRWSTDVTTNADAAGRAKARCFFGRHDVKAQLASGQTLHGAFTAARSGPRTIDVALG